MAIGREVQRQDGGEGSTNYQAGQDIHVHGLTVEEARIVALDVFRSNAVELAGTAQAVAAGRAMQVVEDFMAKIEADMPERAGKLSDPDVQNAVFEAQVGFARSGEEELKSTLVNLLGRRVNEDDRNLRSLALNEAIISAPKLTEQQRRGLAWVYYIRGSRPAPTQTVHDYFADLEGAVAALGVDIPRNSADYQHMEYVGVTALLLTELTFGAAIHSGAEGFFTRGFAENDSDPALLLRLRESQLVHQSVWDADLLQLSYSSDHDFEEIFTRSGFKADLETLMRVGTTGRMSTEEAADAIVEKIPGLAPIRDVWETVHNGPKSMRLSSVGLALANVYFVEATGHEMPLESWLP